MKISPRIFSFFLFICLGKPLFAQSSLGSYFVQSPCPADGVPVIEVEDSLTADMEVKRFPVDGINCSNSALKTAYKEYVFYLGSQPTLPVRLEGENVRLDVYDLEYTPSSPCKFLVKTITPSQWDTLKNLPANGYVVFVVSSIVPVDSTVNYSIHFGKETGRIPDKCLYSCDQFNEGLKTFPGEPLDIQISNPYELSENLVLVVGNDCKNFAIRSHNFISEDSSFTISSVYIHRPKLVETDFELDTLVLDCELGDFSLSSIETYVRNTYAAEEVEGFTALLSTLSEPYCHLEGILSDYRFIGLDEVYQLKNDTFELKADIVNFCTGEAFQYSQVIIVNRKHQQDSVQFDDVVKPASPLNCTTKFTFPEPQGFAGCDPNSIYYNVEGPVPVTLENGQYVAEIPVGNHTFEYRIFDCCHVSPVTGTLEITVIAPDLIASLPDRLGLNSSSIQLPQDFFFQTTYHPCYNIDPKIVASSSSCGPVAEGKIPLCCDDIIIQNDSFIGYGLIEVTAEIDIDVSNDGIFGNGNDSKNIYTINFFLYDVVKEIQCPGDLILPCTTMDISPEVTGQAIVNATCYDQYIPQFTDHNVVVNPDKTVITRTFKFTDAFSTQQCEQKITLDCTVHTENVGLVRNTLIISPNPFVDRTEVTYYSSATQDAALSILNAAGQMVYRQSVQLNPGENSLTLTADHLSSSGMYTLQLRTNNQIHQTKIVKVD